MHLQLDNASENKSRQFLAFIAYLIEMRIFHVVKLSYLIVGHTHEDVDQYFSVISRFFRKLIMCIYSNGGFISALMACFKTPGCIPKCVEQICYCYDTSSLAETFLDQKLGGFDPSEKTGNKIHHFIFRRNCEGKTVMQYKYKRYSDAVYPRTKGEGSIFLSEQHGEGLVLSSTPTCDAITKKKYWCYSVQFTKQDGSTFVDNITQPADEAITMFSRHEANQLPTEFPFAQFNDNWEETLEQSKISIEKIIQKLELKATHLQEVLNWEHFWATLPSQVSSCLTIAPFAIPPPQHLACLQSKTQTSACLDDGNRKVQQVVYDGYGKTQQKQQIETINTLLPSMKLDPLEQGDFVVVDMVPTNADWYTLPFLICKIIQDVSQIDTTLPDQLITVQVFRPTSLQNPHEKRYIPWKGNDN